VVDVRCDYRGNSNSNNWYNYKDNDKKDGIAICHNGQSMCLPVEAIAAHLAHGDKLGACATVAKSNARVEKVVKYVQELGLTIYPNPAHGKTNIEFTMVQQGSYRLAIYDLKGVLLADLAAGDAESNQFFSFQLDAKAYPVGVYLVRLTTDKEVLTKRLFIEK
jgi:hypothetical protein